MSIFAENLPALAFHWCFAKWCGGNWEK